MGKCCLHFKQLDDLELTSVAKVIRMSTPMEYLAYYRRVKGLASRSRDTSSACDLLAGAVRVTRYVRIPIGKRATSASGC